jgi:hypothetical protein
MSHRASPLRIPPASQLCSRRGSQHHYRPADLLRNRPKNLQTTLLHSQACNQLDNPQGNQVAIQLRNLLPGLPTHPQDSQVLAPVCNQRSSRAASQQHNRAVAPLLGLLCNLRVDRLGSLLQDLQAARQCSQVCIRRSDPAISPQPIPQRNRQASPPSSRFPGRPANPRRSQREDLAVNLLPSLLLSPLTCRLASQAQGQVVIQQPNQVTSRPNGPAVIRALNQPRDHQ